MHGFLVDQHASSGSLIPQHLTMLALWRADEPLTVGDVGARLRLDSGISTPVLKRREGAGMLSVEGTGRGAPGAARGHRRGREQRDRVAHVPRALVKSLSMRSGDG